VPSETECHNVAVIDEVSKIVIVAARLLVEHSYRTRKSLFAASVITRQAGLGRKIFPC
jgi:hypothetical protein